MCGAEQDFFASLEKLQKEYRLNPVDVSGKPYPYNVLLALESTKTQLQRTGRDISLSVQKYDNGQVCLSTTETFNPGTTLYYIPVVPLYKMLQDKRQQSTAELLLSVCTYLYKSAGVPYYRDEGTALYYQYEFLKDCEEENIDEENEYSNAAELDDAEKYGDIIHAELYRTMHLNEFQQRIDSYDPKSEYEFECIKTAKEAFALLNEQLNESVFRHTKITIGDDEYDDEIIRAEQYISFVAETEGEVYSQIEQMLNDEFNECGRMEMPTLTKHYDNQYMPDGKTLEFEYRLFALIENICFLFNNTP
ncbi:hypothetical protein ACLI09_02580 [Flavobacterium sp. RHBU_24]|uniref:hypothetical protein n=1 Tax=Flavobacterium sp. RHBU_24 TaxID=3391185 RepID=UPI003984E1ED